MEERRVKVFSDFSEIDENNQKKYKNFQEFNNFLEKNRISSYDDIYFSYLKVFGKEEDNFFDYSELDFQVKYLLEEKKVVVSRILDFAGFKFPDLKSHIIDFLSKDSFFGDIPFFNFDDFVGDLLKQKKGAIFVYFKEIDGSRNQGFPINFNFDDENLLESLKEFRKSIKEFDIEKKIKETGMFPLGIVIQ